MNDNPSLRCHRHASEERPLTLESAIVDMKEPGIPPWIRGVAEIPDTSHPCSLINALLAMRAQKK